MSGEGDSGDSSDYSAKPSTSANSRRITRSSRNASASASCSSSSRATAGVSNSGGSKKKRRIVMRIEFDDDSDESSSTSNSSGMSDDASNEKQIRNSRKNNSIKAHSEHDEIKPCASSSRIVRGKLGKKSNFVFNSDNDDSEDDVPVGGIRRRNRRNRQILEDEDAEEEGVSSNGREISENIQNVSQNASQQDDNGFNSDSSSNELLEKCPICLLSFRVQEIGSPATCQHIFCANCIEAWSKNVQTCPIDRIEFDRIIVRESFENRAVIREVNVCKADCVDKINLSDDDVTHCEVCNRTDREEVMLLCDSCNQGYHIDCLTPALSEIPEGSWYCDNCFDSENEDSDMADDLNELYADIRDMGIPETRLRVTEVHQPRILRTRQNERIRAAIISRTRSSTRNQTQNVDTAASTSRAASTSSRSTRTVRNSSRTAALVPKTRRRRRRRRRARQRTYVVEYDLNNFDEKFAIKTTKRVIRRRRKKRTQRRALSQRQLEILNGGRQTASKRLAEQLGVKSTDRETRAAASSQTFSLFGNANDLEYFSDSDNGVIDNQIEISTGGGGPTAVQTSVRVSSFRTHRGKKGLLSRLEREPPSSNPDLLSNIMDLQDRWHNASRHMDAVRIGQDGSLNLPPSSASDSPRLAAGNKSVSATTEPTATATQPSNIEITQAPMYTRGGGNNNRNFNSGGGGTGGNTGGGNYNNRYNNQSTYRGGGGNNYHNNFSSSSGGNTGSGLAGAGNLFNMVGRGNFSFSSQSNDNPNNSNANNNNASNRDRFNQRNNNRSNQRNSLPLNNNQSNDNMITMNQSPLQQHRQQNRSNQPIISQYPNSQQQNLGMGSNTSLQHPPPFPCSLPGPQPMFGSRNQPIQPLLTQPPPMFPMLRQQQQQPPPLVAPIIPPLMGNPISAPPLPAPPAFNSSLFQLTSDYDNDEDDDSNCPNFSVYSMQSLQVAKSDVRTAAESKGETPKEDDENEDLVQLSDDDEATGTNKDDEDESEIPLPPTPSNVTNALEQNKRDLYEPDQPTFESDDENEFDIASNVENKPSNEDKQNNDPSNNEIELQQQISQENDMEIESQDSTMEKKVSSETSQIDENEETEVEKREDVQSQSEKIISHDESKNKSSASRKGVLELYDDSDWEEMNMERPNVDDYQIRTPPLDPNTSNIHIDIVDKREKEGKSDEEDKENDEEEKEQEGEEERNMTPNQPKSSSSLAESTVVNNNEKGEKDKEGDEDEEDKEQDRSYTPCLDEKNEEENDGACTPELAGPSINENNAEEESHTPDHAAVRTDTAGIAGMETELISEDDDSDKRDKNKRGKGTKDKEQFKKISKNQKDRNYRTEKALNDTRRKSRSRRRRSRSRTNDKENNGFYRRAAQRGGRFKRREIPRYNVRNVVNHQRSIKDRYGRDTSRPARSTSRTRRRRSFSRSVSRSRSRSKSRSRSRSRSISGSPPKKRPRRSFSISPSPSRHNVRRQSMSPHRRSRTPRRRSPIRHNSRTPLRIRSRSNTPPRRNKHKTKKAKRSLTPLNRTRSLSRFTPRLSRSRTPPRHKNVKRLKDRNKKKKKKRQASPSPQPESPWTRVPSRRESLPPKRKRHHTPKGKSPVVDQGWSPSPSPPRPYLHENISWTPPLTFPEGVSRLHRNDQYNEFPIPSKPPKEKKRREKKKKKSEKRRPENSRNKDKRRREPGVLSQAAPSKEVFASGSNILVSVSFNKDGTQPQQHTVVTLPPTREEVLAGIRGRSKDRQTEQQVKKKRRKDIRKRKKNDMKPIAIIDLERSPFQVMQEPTDVIVLTDSEGNGQDDDENLNISRESGNAIMTEMDHHEGSSHRSANIDKTPPLDRLQAIMEESYENAIQQQGPKTPPEPQSGIKFNLINKNKQKQIRNLLHDSGQLESDENQEEEGPEVREPMQQNTNKVGPNTPPESGPCSPDVYDPFDPTKSPSMSPRSPTPPLDVSQHETAPENDKHSTEDLRSETRMTVSSGGPVAPEKNTLNPVDLVMALMNTKASSSQDLANKSNETQYNSNQVVNLIDDNEKPEETSTSNLGITILSNVIYAPGKNQHIPIISSPPLSKSSSNKPPPKVANILSNLPGLGNRHNGDGDGIINEIESPYSPGSADYEDLFDPPPETNGNTKRRRGDKRGGKKEGDVFENLFGSSPTNQFARSSNVRKYKAAVASARNKHKMIVKVQKVPGNNNDDHVKVYDDLPNSAVELQVKDKFLRKLNRQERVVEEVKMILKPRFNKKQISKDDYKEIMRRAVPKICHSKSGEINPKKIKNLIEAYVKKFRQKHRKLNIPNTGQVSSAVKCAAYLKKL